MNLLPGLLLGPPALPGRPGRPLPRGEVALQLVEPEVVGRLLLVAAGPLLIIFGAETGLSEQVSLQIPVQTGFACTPLVY